MIRGLYMSATGMIVQEMRQDVIGNNLVNATTSGFKGETATTQPFPEMLLYRLGEGRATPVGNLGPGVMVDGVHTNYAPGVLEETGRSTDLALVQAGGGENLAFFTVQVGAGVAYTRNGSFHMDADGFLVTPEGHYLQGPYGPVYAGTPNFQVNGSGQVLVNGQVVDQLQIVTFARQDLPRLQRQGDNLFTAPQGVQPGSAAGVQVRQGWLEKANVDVTREMVDMLAVLRAYEANQRAIQAEDQTLGKSVNEVGSLR
ncbi:MAG: flagellar basal-body rod protein FlgF [Clostridia bacterium]|nr:flagellar basal-body rod protein FlgF [Clostridia bacterium]